MRIAVAGGIFHDCAVHDIDIMCWILGEYPHRVTAHVYAHTPEIAAIGDYDTVAVVLSYPSGTIGLIDLSRNSTYGYDQRLEVLHVLRFIDDELGVESVNPSSQ